MTPPRILAGGVTSFHVGFCSVGGASFGIGWPLVCLFALCLAATMGQIASAFPTAGGLYHWSAILSGRSWGWVTAWFNLAGLVAVLAAINVGTFRFAVGAFVDATHFVWGTYLCCLGTILQVFIRAASGRQRFNVLGAWNAVTRQLLCVTNTTVVNTDTMCELLRTIAAQALVGPVTVVLDNAPYQRNTVVQGLAAEVNEAMAWLTKQAKLNPLPKETVPVTKEPAVAPLIKEYPQGAGAWAKIKDQPKAKQYRADRTKLVLFSESSELLGKPVAPGEAISILYFPDAKGGALGMSYCFALEISTKEDFFTGWALEARYQLYELHNIKEGPIRAVGSGTVMVMKRYPMWWGFRPTAVVTTEDQLAGRFWSEL